MGYRRRASTTQSAEEVFDEIQPVLRTRRPATTCAASATSGCGETPVQWPCPPDGAGDRNPIRYLNDGVSQTCSSTPTAPAAAGVPDRRRGRAVFFARPHLPPAELPDDDFPFVLNTGRLQHQWHTHDQDRQGRQAQQAQPGPVRRDPPRRRRRARHRRRRPGRGRLPARPGRAARRRHRPGAAGQLLRAVPLERPVRRVPARSTPSPTTPSTRSRSSRSSRCARSR